MTVWRKLDDDDLYAVGEYTNMFLKNKEKNIV